MARIASILFILLVVPGPAAPAQAPETFELSVRLESADFPALDAEMVIRGRPGQTFDFTGDILLASAGIMGDEGPQGWSLSVLNDGIDLVSSTWAGTASDDVANGGFFGNGFRIVEVLDPRSNRGQQGMLMAVVLDFITGTPLPPNTTQVLVRNTYRATVAPEPAFGLIKFEEPLRGGMPVVINVTFRGETRIPIRMDKRIAIIPGEADCPPSMPSCEQGLGSFELLLTAPGAVREGMKNVVEVSPEPGTVIEVTASIAPAGDPGPHGAEGWSVSVAHDAKLAVEAGVGFPTIEGTDARTHLAGDGFQKTEVVDPGQNGGRLGFISAVVLSFSEDRQLDPTQTQSVARSRYRIAAGVNAGDFPLAIMLLDGLRGSGEPVDNVVAVRGLGLPPANAIPLELAAAPSPSKKFRRGDANDDGKRDVADPIWTINELVRQGQRSSCRSAADANDDGRVDLSDAMYAIAWQFLGGPPPPAPSGVCGDDPTGDSLPCPAGSQVACP